MLGPRKLTPLLESAAPEWNIRPDAQVHPCPTSIRRFSTRFFNMANPLRPWVFRSDSRCPRTDQFMNGAIERNQREKAA